MLIVADNAPIVDAVIGVDAVHVTVVVVLLVMMLVVLLFFLVMRVLVWRAWCVVCCVLFGGC